jgi:hypothetical protein
VDSGPHRRARSLRSARPKSDTRMEKNSVRSSARFELPARARQTTSRRRNFLSPANSSLSRHGSWKSAARYLTSASKYNHSKPEQRSPTDAVVDQRYAIWTIPHYPLVAIVADPRWRERGAAFASTLVTNNPDHCFTAPISPAITNLDNDASRQSLRLWCGGSACSYTPTEAFSRCGGNLELSQHR